MELKINAFQHSGIPVANLQESVFFYEGLGFELVLNTEFGLGGPMASGLSLIRSSVNP